MHIQAFSMEVDWREIWHYKWMYLLCLILCFYIVGQIWPLWLCACTTSFKYLFFLSKSYIVEKIWRKSLMKKTKTKRTRTSIKCCIGKTVSIFCPKLVLFVYILMSIFFIMIQDDILNYIFVNISWHYSSNSRQESRLVYIYFNDVVFHSDSKWCI